MEIGRRLNFLVEIGRRLHSGTHVQAACLEFIFQEQTYWTLDSADRMELSTGLFLAVFIWLSMEFNKCDITATVMLLQQSLSHRVARQCQQPSSLLNLNYPLYN